MENTMVKSYPIIALLLVYGLLSACESEPQSNQAAVCDQVSGTIERNSVELQKPRDWNRLMTAGSRLVYIRNDCGALVTESKEDLCASLADAIHTFENNPGVPLGPNRDNALAISNKTFSQSDCADISAP
jgi:hypothetical protein